MTFSIFFRSLSKVVFFSVLSALSHLSVALDFAPPQLESRGLSPASINLTNESAGDEAGSAAVWTPYGGTTMDNDSYAFPLGSEDWAGFANDNADLNPFSFPNGGTLTFTGAIPAGGKDLGVYFTFEANPYPNANPYFETEPVVVTGEAEATYTVAIPDQDDQTFNSFLMFLATYDASVIVKDVVIAAEGGGANTGGTEPDSGGSGSIYSSAVGAVFVDAVVDSVWGGNNNFMFFDEASGDSDCSAGLLAAETCDSVDWAIVADADRGDLLQVNYSSDAQHAGLVLGKLASDSLDLSAFSAGTLSFEIKVMSMGEATGFLLKLESGNSNSGEIALSGISGSGEWETVNVPMTTLIAGGLDISLVSTAMVFSPAYQTGSNLVYQLDNVRFVAPAATGLEAIDSEKWFHQTLLPDGNGWYNNEVQHYTNRIENSYVSDGTLKIVAKRESFTDQSRTKQFTSARLNSKYAFTYGRVDVRAKLPEGNGTWPAIWTLGQNITENGGYWETQGFGTSPWPYSGEIDIMEHWGREQNYVSSALHTPSSYGGTINKGEQYIPTTATEFHTYSVDWNADRMIFSVDGVEHYTYAPEDKDTFTWPFDSPQYLLPSSPRSEEAHV